jgi:hypothetical protein
VTAGKRCHRLRFRDVERQRFLHHDVQLPRCGGLDHRPMFRNGPECKDRFRLCPVQHRCEPIMHHRRIYPEFSDIPGRDRTIGLVNADHLYGALRKIAKKTGDMAVGQPSDSHA